MYLPLHFIDTLPHHHITSQLFLSTIHPVADFQRAYSEWSNLKHLERGGMPQPVGALGVTIQM